jgi:hypothetical protein
VSFNKKEEMERCLRELQNAVIRDKQIILSVKLDKKSFNLKANVYVRSIHKDVKQ